MCPPPPPPPIIVLATALLFRSISNLNCFDKLVMHNSLLNFRSVFFLDTLYIQDSYTATGVKQIVYYDRGLNLIQEKYRHKKYPIFRIVFGH